MNKYEVWEIGEVKLANGYTRLEELKAIFDDPWSAERYAETNWTGKYMGWQETTPFIIRSIPD